MSEIATLRPMMPAAPASEGEVLPHNIEAEQQLLGAILTNNDIYDRIAAIIRRSISSTRSTSASMKLPWRASRRMRSLRP